MSGRPGRPVVTGVRTRPTQGRPPLLCCPGPPRQGPGRVPRSGRRAPRHMRIVTPPVTPPPLTTSGQGPRGTPYDGRRSFPLRLGSTSRARSRRTSCPLGRSTTISVQRRSPEVVQGKMTPVKEGPRLSLRPPVTETSPVVVSRHRQACPR